MLILVLLCALHRESIAFVLKARYCKSINTLSYTTKSNSKLQQSTTIIDEEHPAVLGWPAKYEEAGGNAASKENGPRVLSTSFEVHKATGAELTELDVLHWPTWTTSDKPKWDVGNQIVDKEMPYGELSYVISGKLEIIPQSDGEKVIVNVGDLVTFPRGSIASWKVLEELTWHYYLY